MEIVYYSDDRQYAFFNGVKYSKNKAGYYVATVKANATNTNISKLHRAVWSYHNGEISKWYDVHHKDGDKENNKIENLMCIEHSHHQKHHISTILGNVSAYTCINCNKSFSPNEPSQKYCSIKCANQYRHRQKMVYYTRVCRWCGKEFTTNRIDRVYCKNMCGQADRTKAYRLKKRQSTKD